MVTTPFAGLRVIDLSDRASGAFAIAALVGGADVLVTTAGPIAGASFAGALARLRPDAVHLLITAHGLAGRLAGHPGNNLTASARTGCRNGAAHTLRVSQSRCERPTGAPAPNSSLLRGS